MDADTNALLENAQLVSTEVEQIIANLNLSHAAEEYKAQDFANLTESSLFLNPSDPTVVSQDLAATLSHVRKLKFNFLELNAKGRYTNIIVSDEQPDTSQEVYEQLHAKSAEDKALLKEAKEQLADTYRYISEQAPELDKSCLELEADLAEIDKLRTEILDAQLELSRLQARHPAPRLTVSKATAIADEQVQKMMALEEEMQQIEREIAEKREENKAVARDVEKLRIERGKLESQYKALNVEPEEDARISELFEWYSASMDLHKNLLSIDSFSRPSTNAINITYRLPEPVTIQLVFHPGTEKLANAQLINPPPPFDKIDIQDLVALYAMSGDARTFLPILLSRLRARS
jgi:chromosome segregation ATPase